MTLIINLCALVIITFQRNVFFSREIIKIALKGSVHGDLFVTAVSFMWSRQNLKGLLLLWSDVMSCLLDTASDENVINLGV